MVPGGEAVIVNQILYFKHPTLGWLKNGSYGWEPCMSPESLISAGTEAMKR